MHKCMYICVHMCIYAHTYHLLHKARDLSDRKLLDEWKFVFHFGSLGIHVCTPGILQFVVDLAGFQYKALCFHYFGFSPEKKKLKHLSLEGFFAITERSVLGN